MIIDGIDVEAFLRSFDGKVLEGVLHFLRVFPRYKELTDYMEQWEWEQLEQSRQHSLERAKERARDPFSKAERRPEPPPTTTTYDQSREPDAPQEIFEPPGPFIPVGFCPDCNEVVFGGPLPQCEVIKSGRVFYKECSSCPYFSEIFLIEALEEDEDDKFKEVRGG